MTCYQNRERPEIIFFFIWDTKSKLVSYLRDNKKYVNQGIIIMAINNRCYMYIIYW